MCEFKDGQIEGVVVRKLVHFVDDRGWLCELFRSDEVKKDDLPAMCYASGSRPGATRGPHEHVDQTDGFCFLGPSDFLLMLWDNRPASPTYRNRMRLVAGEGAPTAVLVPPGIVHGYRNIGKKEGLVINLPNRLYKGEGRREPIDEIRHEDDPLSPFKVEE